MRCAYFVLGGYIASLYSSAAFWKMAFNIFHEFELSVSVKKFLMHLASFSGSELTFDST